MGRAPCCDKTGLKKGPWTPDEDQILVDYIQKRGHGSWRALPKHAALQMSMQEATKGSSGSMDMSKVLGDQSFVSSVLASLPGVDPNDPSVKDVLASLQDNGEEKEKGQEKQDGEK